MGQMVSADHRIVPVQRPVGKSGSQMPHIPAFERRRARSTGATQL